MPSDQDASIFNNTVQQTTEQQTKDSGNTVFPSQESDPLNTLLGSIKNEQGQPKYNNPVDALNALKHSQEFIPQLKQENASLRSEIEQLRAQVDKLKGVEEVVERLTSQQNNTATPGKVLDENAIADLVQRTLSKREVEAVQKANVTSVVQTLQSQFGQEAEKAFYGKAQELGMSVQQMNSLAATSPQAVLQLFGVQKRDAGKVNTPSAVPSGVNTAGFQPKQDTYIARNTKGVTVGATSQEVADELHAAKKMVEELQQQGMSVDDLSNPKNYKKFFR